MTTRIARAGLSCTVVLGLSLVGCDGSVPTPDHQIAAATPSDPAPAQPSSDIESSFAEGMTATVRSDELSQTFAEGMTKSKRATGDASSSHLAQRFAAGMTATQQSMSPRRTP